MWPFNRIQLVHLAALMMAAFGVYQLAVGILVMLREGNMQNAVNANGISLSAFMAISGLLLVILSFFVALRKNWARVVAVFWLLFHANLSFVEQYAEAQNEGDFAVAIGGAVFWMFPILLSVFLVNQTLVQEFLPVENDVV